MIGMGDENHISVGGRYRQLRQELTPTYGAGEATAMARLIFHSLKGWDTTGLVVHEGDILSPFILQRIEEIVEELKNGRPLQYILGEADFYGMRLRVDESTLIPRPETEELVDMIVKDADNRADLRVLDVGAGSGAIAIALARNLRFPEIKGIDISREALKVAEANAKALHAPVAFEQKDIFEYAPAPDSYDIIVSNPPYICEREKIAMERNVLDYEPAQALFVTDDDPLKFYIRIAEIGTSALSGRGGIYFEINPLYALDMVTMMEESGYCNVETIKDLSGKPRFVKGMKGDK